MVRWILCPILRENGESEADFDFDWQHGIQTGAVEKLKFSDTVVGAEIEVERESIQRRICCLTFRENGPLEAELHSNYCIVSI